MSDQTTRIAEAWWGGRADLTPGARALVRPDVVHLVDWPAGREHGYSLCRKHLDHRKVFDLGSAAAARVAVCGPCTRALESRRRPGTVRTISSSSSRRRDYPG